MASSAGSSRFVRGLAIFVFVASIAFVYHARRIRPHGVAMDKLERQRTELQDSIVRLRGRVAELEQESRAAMQWAGYAEAIAAHSQARSVDEILRTATAGVRVREFRLGGGEAGERLRSVEITLGLEGRFDEVLRLMRELERAFPPIVVERSTLQMSDDRDAPDDQIVVTLEGVLHEPL